MPNISQKCQIMINTWLLTYRYKFPDRRRKVLGWRFDDHLMTNDNIFGLNKFKVFKYNMKFWLENALFITSFASSLITNKWPSDDRLMTVWWQSYDSLMTPWWLTNDHVFGLNNFMVFITMWSFGGKMHYPSHHLHRGWPYCTFWGHFWAIYCQGWRGLP